VQSGPVQTAIYAQPLDGSAPAFVVVKPQSNEGRLNQPRLSPDGRWLAYISTDSGSEEVYVTDFPKSTGRWQISREGGAWPVWRQDSREIYFVSTNTQLYAQEVQVRDGAFGVGPSHPLWSVQTLFPQGYPYDVAPDGKRFLVVSRPTSATAPQVLISNWTSDLSK
jgi:serine/threonine-protein kinase